MSALETDKRAIAAAWNRAIEALATCNWPEYSSVWAHTDYVQAIHPARASWWMGWGELGERYRAIIEKGIPIHGKTRCMDIHVGASGDVAWATMENEIRVGKGGRVAWQVVVFEKIDGEWQMVLAFDAPKRASG